MYLKAGMFKPDMGRAEYNLVMGVASGMPCDADLLALLPHWMAPGSVWQTTLIGRAEIWPVHQKTAELGGMLRTGTGRHLLFAQWRTWQAATVSSSQNWRRVHSGQACDCQSHRKRAICWV